MIQFDTDPPVDGRKGECEEIKDLLDSRIWTYGEDRWRQCGAHE